MADVKELNINSTTYDIKAKSVVDNNSGAVKFWTGTKAQYNAIVTKDSKTQYTCTDTGEIYLGDIKISVTDLSGKADVDLTNCTNVASIKMAHNAMPSNTYTDLTLGASGTSYTAPADGYVFVSKATTGVEYFNLQTGGSTDATVKMEDSRTATMAGTLLTCTIPVTKGETFYTVYNASGATILFRFYYAVGSESEAS